MNSNVRNWIIENRQPWHDEIILKNPANKEVLEYYNLTNTVSKTNFVQDLLEKELIEIFNEIITWLPVNEQKNIRKNIGFGYSQTFEPNACCIKVDDGYAILLDSHLDLLIISTTELYFDYYFAKKINTPTFDTAYINSILAIYFGTCEFKPIIPDEGFEFREDVNKWSWLISVFVLLHEVGHFSLGHFKPKKKIEDTPAIKKHYESKVEFQKGDSIKKFHIIRNDERDEFQADYFSISTFIEHQKKLIPNKRN